MKIIEQLNKNKYSNCLFKIILFSAIVHLFFIAIKVITSGNVGLLNYFKIIGLDLFFPKISDSRLSLVLGLIFMGLLYLLFILRQSGSKNIDK